VFACEGHAQEFEPALRQYFSLSKIDSRNLTHMFVCVCKNFTTSDLSFLTRLFPAKHINMLTKCPHAGLPVTVSPTRSTISVAHVT
jgi:hypothetical protein